MLLVAVPARGRGAPSGITEAEAIAEGSFEAVDVVPGAVAANVARGAGPALFAGAAEPRALNACVTVAVGTAARNTVGTGVIRATHGAVGAHPSILAAGARAVARQRVKAEHPSVTRARFTLGAEVVWEADITVRASKPTSAAISTMAVAGGTFGAYPLC